MFGKLKMKLKENNNFYYFANIMRYTRKQEFRDFVRGFGGGDTIFLTHPGLLYPDKLVYCIKNVGWRYGFFAEMRDTIKYLFFADRFHLTPVVFWNNEGFYSEKNFNGTDNVFEYYFLPTAEIKQDEIANCRNVIPSFPKQMLAISDGDWNCDYWRDATLRLRMGEIYRKYCKLNEATQKYIDDNLRRVIKEKMLGIHIRQTDFKRNLPNHPVAIEPTEFILNAKKMIKQKGYKKIFLATDSIEVTKLFEKEFGEKVCFYKDIQRSDGNVGLHLLKSNRENHHYMLGLEVLRDVYTLASCDSLLAGKSNVSLGAWYIKLAKGFEYNEVVILDHGSGSGRRKKGNQYIESMINSVKDS